MISRRGFLAKSGGVVAGALAATVLKASEGANTMRLGGPVFVKSDDPAILAKAHRDLGYRAAYAPSDLSVTDKDRIAGLVREFARQDVVIAEVGAWKNMLDPDLWYAQNPRNLSQEFIDATVENCRKLIDAVKPTRTCFSIEMMPWSFPTGPDEYVRLVKAVDRKAFGVHLDVCNTMNSPTRFYNNSAGIRECFAKLGPWIKSCHAKDLKWGPGVQVWIQEVIPGTGLIDYKTLLQELSRLGTEAPLMLEHLHNEAEYTQGRQYIQGVARSMGLSFGA
jgi:sugar phosphate isomerase/epimerase